MRVPTQRKTGIGAAAYATTPTIPRYGPAGARLVLNALRGLPDGETVLDRKSVERLWKDHVQLDKCIASLDEDGLIEILPGGGVRLPV